MATTTNNKKQTTRGKYAKKDTTSKTTFCKTVASRKATTTSTPATVTTRKRTRPMKRQRSLGMTLERLYNKISKNDVKWFWDVKKWIPIIIIMLLISYVFGYNRGENEQIAYFESIPAETIYIEVTQPVEIVKETEPVRDEEAVKLAILADTSAAGKSREVKRILMWVAINRVEDRANGYGRSLIDEIDRPKQWQNYNPDGMYLLETYDLALEVLDIWKTNGPRPLYNDMLWSVYNADGTITVRNRFGNEKGRMEQTYG